MTWHSQFCSHRALALVCQPPYASYIASYFDHRPNSNGERSANSRHLEHFSPDVISQFPSVSTIPRCELHHCMTQPLPASLQYRARLLQPSLNLYPSAHHALHPTTIVVAPPRTRPVSSLGCWESVSPSETKSTLRHLRVCPSTRPTLSLVRRRRHPRAALDRRRPPRSRRTHAHTHVPWRRRAYTRSTTATVTHARKLEMRSYAAHCKCIASDDGSEPRSAPTGRDATQTLGGVVPSSRAARLIQGSRCEFQYMLN